MAAAPAKSAKRSEMPSHGAQLVHGRRPARVDVHLAGTQLGRRRQGGPGGTTGAEHGHAVHCGHSGRPQRLDHAGGVGVLGVPTVASPYQRIGGTQHGRDRGDPVGHHERHLFERHGQ
jgi:hypothetical protein